MSRLSSNGRDLCASRPPTHPTLRSAKALSKYTDMVDAVVREALDKLAGATDGARIALRQVRVRAQGGQGGGRFAPVYGPRPASACRIRQLCRARAPPPPPFLCWPTCWPPARPPADRCQAELPELLEALDGATPAAAVPEGLARELEEVQGIGGSAHLRGVRAPNRGLRAWAWHSSHCACSARPLLRAARNSRAAARALSRESWQWPCCVRLARTLGRHNQL